MNAQQEQAGYHQISVDSELPCDMKVDSKLAAEGEVDEGDCDCAVYLEILNKMHEPKRQNDDSASTIIPLGCGDRDEDNEHDNIVRLKTRRMNRRAFALGFLCCFCLSMMAYPYALIMTILVNQQQQGEERSSVAELLDALRHYVFDFNSYLPLVASAGNVLFIYLIASQSGKRLVEQVIVKKFIRIDDEEVTDSWSFCCYLWIGFVHGFLVTGMVVTVFLAVPLPWPLRAMCVQVVLLDAGVLALHCIRYLSFILRLL